MMIRVDKTEMGGILRKICCKTDDHANGGDGSENADSPEEFYRYLRLELEDDEIYRLKYLFYSIKIVEHQVGRAFYKFVSTKKFRRKFKTELDKHRSRIHNDANLQGCLMDHCFAVIWVHLDILKAIQSPHAVHKLLYDIAACHIHFKDFNELLQVHDALLFRFIKIEFDKYTNKFTLQSLDKYLKIIRNRIMILKEDMERKEKAENIAKAVLKMQRTSLEKRIMELNSLRQIYSGVRIQSSTNFFEDYNTAGTSLLLKADVSTLEKIESGILTNFFTDLEDSKIGVEETHTSDSMCNLQKVQGSFDILINSEDLDAAGTSTEQKADESELKKIPSKSSNEN